jgi:hypothetical protein
MVQYVVLTNTVFLRKNYKKHPFIDDESTARLFRTAILWTWNTDAYTATSLSTAFIPLPKSESYISVLCLWRDLNPLFPSVAGVTQS